MTPHFLTWSFRPKIVSVDRICHQTDSISTLRRAYVGAQEKVPTRSSSLSPCVVGESVPRTDGRKSSNLLQTKTSCRLETDIDDCFAAVTVAVAAYRRCKQRMENINQLLALVLGVGLLHVEDTIVAREYICSLCNACRTAVTSSVQIICWRELAQCCLHSTLRPSSCIRVVVQSSKRSQTK